MILNSIFDITGEIVQNSKCEVAQEFQGVNHKTSHDGLFKIKAKDISQKILNEIGGIRVKMSGSFVGHGKKTFNVE